MINKDLIKELPKDVTAKYNVNLAKYSSFRVGGLCPLFIDCPTSMLLADTINILNKYAIKFIIIGEGTNILVSDDGLSDVVIRFCSNTEEVVIKKNKIISPAQINLDDLVVYAINSNLGDISYLSGIPGTVGGAVSGNAGAFGKQIGDVIISGEIITSSGLIKKISPEEFNFSYRSSSLKESSNYLLKITLSLEQINKDHLLNERNRILSLRKDKHPDWKKEPCAGSVFRNIEPTSAAEKRQAAGWFLEEAGVKDFKEGGAYIYPKHANIIIAGESATAKDVYLLSQRMKKAVKDKFNINLVREIKLLGNY